MSTLISLPVYEACPWNRTRKISYKIRPDSYNLNLNFLFFGCHAIIFTQTRRLIERFARANLYGIPAFRRGIPIAAPGILIPAFSDARREAALGAVRHTCAACRWLKLMRLVPKSEACAQRPRFFRCKRGLCQDSGRSANRAASLRRMGRSSVRLCFT